VFNQQLPPPIAVQLLSFLFSRTPTQPQGEGSNVKALQVPEFNCEWYAATFSEALRASQPYVITEGT